MSIRETFINTCVGAIATTSAATFLTVYDMKTSIAVSQEDLARTKADIARMEHDIDRLKDDLAQNTLEVVRLRAVCEKLWERNKRR